MLSTQNLLVWWSLCRKWEQQQQQQHYETTQHRCYFKVYLQFSAELTSHSVCISPNILSYKYSVWHFSFFCKTIKCSDHECFMLVRDKQNTFVSVLVCHGSPMAKMRRETTGKKSFQYEKYNNFVFMFLFANITRH